MSCLTRYALRGTSWLILVALGAGPATAHTGPPPTPGEVWGAWSWTPEVLFAIGVAALLYGRGAGRLWARAGVGRGIPRWRFNCFVGGLVVLFIALVSPLDAMGSALFSAHMVQHEVLILFAAPLLILGNAWTAVLWALPSGWRRRVGRWMSVGPVRFVLRLMVRPVTAWLVYAVALWIWHAPPLYQATLRSDGVHFAQHASFLGSALLFWSVIMHAGRSRRSSYGIGIIYIFTTAVHGSILGALLTFARTPWYPAYAPSAAAWGLTPLEDQQLGGLIMWVPPGFIYLIVAIGVLVLWFRTLEARDVRRSTREPEYRFSA